MICRHSVLLLFAAVAFVGFLIIPGGVVDRALLSLSAHSSKISRSFVTGEGSHASPYQLHTFGLGIGETPAKAPTIISINDDPDQVFQASPPSPVDFAILLRNLSRLGMDRVAIAMPLTWLETDAISLAALDRQLDTIPSLTTAAPLTRGAVPSPMPPAFRRASIPLSEIKGNSELLPAINRIAIPDVILGNKTSLAGFTQLESEPKGSAPHLLAKWGEERAVLSFILIAALDHYQIPPSDIKIHLGEFIALSARGPYIPIDDHGRLAFSIPSEFPNEALPMESLLKMEETPAEESTFQPAILRNDLTATDEASAAYSRSLAATIAALSDPDYASATRIFHRLPLAVEIILLLALVCFAYGVFISGKYPWKVVVAIALVGILIIHFIATAATATWLPTLPALVIFLTYAAISHFGSQKPITIPEASTSPTPAPSPVVNEVALKEAAPKEVDKKAATKTASKTATKTARKTATKKPRKAAKKRTRKAAKKKPRGGA